MPTEGLSVTGYLAALAIVLLLGTVMTRVLLLRRAGTQAMHFGDLDKTDFLIPPVALFYFYTIFAAAFHWPLVSTRMFFRSNRHSLDRRRTVLHRSAGVVRKPGVVRQEFPGRHRRRPTRQVGNHRHFRRQPQSDLRWVRARVGRSVPGVSQLGSVGLPCRWGLTVPPSSVARGKLYAATLLAGIRGVLPTSQTVSVT